MKQNKRGVSPVISVILMVAIVVILAATISVLVLDLTEDLNDPAPNVADTTGEFEVGAGSNKQVVRITHVAGESVAVEEIEIIARASGPGANLPTEARLVNLPSKESSRLLNENIEGNDDLIDGSSGSAELIADDGVDVWSSGRTIEFRVGVGGADFRNSVPSYNTANEANELEVVIVHTPSNSILSEQTFTP